MKQLAAALALAAAAFPAAAAAPPHAGEERPSYGVGVSVVPLESGGGAPTVEVYLPLNVAPNLRIEPSLGILTRSEPAGGSSSSDVTVGVGVFLLHRAAPALDAYLGGRLKLNFASFEPPGGPRDSGTDVILAAALGGEYYLIPRFSTGLEAQLGYYSASSAAPGGKASGLFTTGLVFLRLYL